MAHAGAPRRVESTRPLRVAPSAHRDLAVFHGNGACHCRTRGLLESRALSWRDQELARDAVWSVSSVGSANGIHRGQSADRFPNAQSGVPSAFVRYALAPFPGRKPPDLLVGLARAVGPRDGAGRRAP